MRFARKAAILAVLLAGVAGLTGCATNPVTGKSQFSLVSADQELSIGREGYQAVLSEYGKYDDGRLEAYVDSVGQSLAKVSHLPNLEWHFTLLDDPTVNAFAMPGGYIYITRGILAHLNSEAQLAGVLGHEIGHVTARHTAARMSQQQLVGIGVGIASVVSPTFQRYGGAAQQALGLMFLKYSRDDETQADELGVQYSTKAGWDPREIPSTYVMLRRVGEQAGQRIPAFMSTHPDPGDREQKTRALATQAAAGKTGLLVRSRDYERRLEGVVFGNDPRQGYVEGTRFVQPEMGIEITFPSGWQVQNTRSAVLAAPSDQSGAMQVTLADSKGLAPDAYVAELERGQRFVEAQGGRETLAGSAAWVGRAGLVQQDGQVAPIVAGFIQHQQGQLLQILGQNKGSEAPVLAAIRSFRHVSGAQLNVPPDVVHVVTVTKTGPFQTVAESFGPLSIAIEPLSILNNVEPQETVAQGTLIKVVKKR